MEEREGGCPHPPNTLCGAGARPRNPSMAAIAIRDSSASNRRQHGGLRLRQRRLSASGLSARRHVGTRNAAFAAHERIATSLAVPVALQEQNGLGARQSSRLLHFSTTPLFHLSTSTPPLRGEIWYTIQNLTKAPLRGDKEGAKAQ